MLLTSMHLRAVTTIVQPTMMLPFKLMRQMQLGCNPHQGNHRLPFDSLIGQRWEKHDKTEPFRLAQGLLKQQDAALG